MSSSRQSLEPHEKIKAARITLLRQYPFWGSMAMKLRPIPLTEEEAKKVMRQPTMGVDIYGNMPYNIDFVKKLTIDELVFVLAHETMHLALEHLTRKGSRGESPWNISADEAINLLLKEEISAPKFALQHEKFKDKSTEEIYDIIVRMSKGQAQNQGLRNEDGSWKRPMDSHVYSKGGTKSGKSGKGGSKPTPFYKKGTKALHPQKMVKDAAVFAKSQGHMPAGMERLFQGLLDPKMNWKELLRKYFMASIPQDWTYTRPSKKSISAGFYMPSIIKKEINIIIGVDTSGSISEAEYTQFLSEIYFMCKSVENLKATVLTCDAAIGDVMEIDNSFDPTFMKGRGYGGTSCRPVFKWIETEKNNDIKLLVYLTDGYIDAPLHRPRFPHLWIVTKNGTTKFGAQEKGGIVIKMEGSTENDKDWR